MRVPLSWLKNYVPCDIPAHELAHRLTMAGNEVGDVEIVGTALDPERLVVGQVLSVDPHPNADRLRLPTVDIGGETATVVCGAPNVAAGQKVAFAKEGAMLFSPRSGKTEALRAATIRGVRSSGMVCSVLELGLGDDHEGILVLDDDAPVGMPLVEYIGDAVLDIDVTPNRPDCLSILGIAHEVAALTGASVTHPDLSYPEDDTPIESLAKVEIADPNLCFRYTATLIHGIHIAESPQWMQDALTKAGLRPINNIVDITNYVMLEYGQPLHAFDFGKVRDNTIIVRSARPDETLETLDGATRVLQPPMLVIADTQDAIGLAGVMGGANTEIDESTTTVLLESANFHAINTRRTRLATRMDSEASYRFERGIRPELAPLALRRATQMMIQLAYGTASKGILDIYPDGEPMPSVQISRQRIRQVLGVDYTMERIERTLEALGFRRDREPESIMPTMDAFSVGGAPETNNMVFMQPPYWRSDITIEDDIVEELARIIGYESIPTTMISTPIPHGQPQAQRVLRELVKDILTTTGMRETISYSLVSENMLERVGVAAGETDAIRIANPMSSEFTLLRTSLRASVLNTLANNRRVSQVEGIRIYEIGSVYLPKEEARERDLPDEREMLMGVLC
ncbi:MAG: phenylalanine--tRNA ligase subunit beta, partial [Chloroflexi bacterium]|nr:phenylalanine--tRNA ligase subunit beta [Chloroflexota bacterium]